MSRTKFWPTNKHAEANGYTESMENRSETKLARTPPLSERFRVSFHPGTEALIEEVARVGQDGGYDNAQEWVRAVVETELHRCRPVDLARIKGLPASEAV